MKQIQGGKRVAMHDIEGRIEGRKVDRREFLQWLTWIAGAIFTVLLGIPLIGFFASVLTRRPTEQWVRVCSLDEIGPVKPSMFRIAFKRDDAHLDYEDVRGVFVIRKGNDILAFTNVCTHMGCSVRWLDWRQQILCPCHGGMYDRWGNLVGGPPARSLPLYVSRIEDNVLLVANRLEPRSKPF